MTGRNDQQRRVLLRTLAGLAGVSLLQPFIPLFANELVVIELNGRTAEELIPLLRPMLAPGGKISGLNDKLIIRTTPSNLAELRAMLDVLDAPPRRLRITVRQDAGRRERDVDLEVSGSVGTSGQPSGASGKRPSEASDGNISASASARASERNSGVAQSVQTLDGSPAYIAIGQSIPVRGSIAADGREYVEYRDVVTGFYATPRVRNERVTVALETSADRVNRPIDGSARIQRAETIVTGELGEWIEVGTISSDADGRQIGIVFFESSAATSESRIYLKVEELR